MSHNLQSNSSVSADKPPPTFVVAFRLNSNKTGSYARRCYVNSFCVECIPVFDTERATKFSIPADAAQFADEIEVMMHPFIPVVWDLNANKEVGPDPSRGG